MRATSRAFANNLRTPGGVRMSSKSDCSAERRPRRRRASRLYGSTLRRELRKEHCRLQYLGLIYAWTGEKDLAINQLAATLQVPSLLSYGELRLHPFWDPLRGDPRFEKLVEEAKKPVALK